MKVRTDYDGLTIGCATAEGRDQVLAATGHTARLYRVIMLETAAGVDYVVTGAVGWKEDHEQDHDPSALAFFPPGSNPDRILPTENPTASG